MIPLPWLDDTVITIGKLENVGVECGPRFRVAVFNNGDALKEHYLQEATIGQIQCPISIVISDADYVAFSQASNLAVGNGALLVLVGQKQNYNLQCLC